MPLPGLTIIGETINDSVPSAKKLFDAGDIPGILDIAKMQDQWRRKENSYAEEIEKLKVPKVEVDAVPMPEIPEVK